jgi:hypothetical protein
MDYIDLLLARILIGFQVIKVNPEVSALFPSQAFNEKLLKFELLSVTCD